jgi:hypothetical protein
MTLTWPLAVVLSAVFASLTALAVLHLVAPAVVTGAAGTLLGWLMPQLKMPMAPGSLQATVDVAPPVTQEKKP